jgi:hypothetical protein
VRLWLPATTPHPPATHLIGRLGGLPAPCGEALVRAFLPVAFAALSRARPFARSGNLPERGGSVPRLNSFRQIAGTCLFGHSPSTQKLARLRAVSNGRLHAVRHELPKGRVVGPDQLGEVLEMLNVCFGEAGLAKDGFVTIGLPSPPATSSPARRRPTRSFSSPRRVMNRGAAGGRLA